MNTCLLLLGAIACGGPEIEVSMQEVRVARGPSQNFLGVDFLATKDGKAVPCNQGEVEVTYVGTSDSEDGEFTAVPLSSVVLTCTDDVAPDFALAIDNSGSIDNDYSGSETDWLELLKDATNELLNAIEPAGGRASLVRVSTRAEVLREVTDDFDTLRSDVDGLEIKNGWTALYDGIRIANRTLGDAYSESAAPPDLDTFCTPSRKTGIVVVTDAKENNSTKDDAIEHDVVDYDDGEDTDLDDLKKLMVNNVWTPIYSVGFGDRVDHGMWTQLKKLNGGRHHRVDSDSDLLGVFNLIADYAFSNFRVCIELPEGECETTFYVRIKYVWTPCDDGGCGGDPVKGEQVYKVYVDCPVEENGRVATVLLTFSKPDIPNTGMEPQVAKQLAKQIVEWVSPTASPKVLVVKDDNHHREFEGDAQYIADLLDEAGIDVTFKEEPESGLEPSDTKIPGTDTYYDVVWLSNPGYPPDDRETLYTLKKFSESGGGYVLQGDDMTWFWCDRGFSMTPYTGLVHQSNGTTFCDHRIDNNATRFRYRVTIDGAEVPMTEALEGAQFYYGDDIDTSYLAGQGEQQLASAVGGHTEEATYCDKEVPVIVIRDPNASEP